MRVAVVEVSGGRVGGAETDGVWSYLGIPYAGPSTGPARWRPPRPPIPWSGVRRATSFGPIAPQPPPTPGLSVAGDPTEQSEDCLNLNVWTPGPDRRRRPVMVWVHGGGFTSGTGSSLLYHGAELAGAHDVVVVTFNYRLGALGFLGHPALSTTIDGSTAIGNFGLLDQVAALRWIRRHIADFGGDPGNVTVFGESAGAMGIAALLAMPSARGLFHRAVVQSGPPYVHRRARAARAAEDLMGVLGLPGVERGVLEQVPADELVAAATVLLARPPDPGELPLPFLPVVDGTVLPLDPLAAVAAGHAADVPLLIGTNRDELSFFVLSDPEWAAMDDERLLRWVRRSAPAVDPRHAVDTYRRARRRRGEPGDPRSLWVALGSDLVFRWPSLRLAAAQRRYQPATFVYLFTWETPVFGGMLGSCHALEIPFVFGGVRHPAIAAFTGGGPAAEALADLMQPAWAAFARSADPSHGALDWPAWDVCRRATMVFGTAGGGCQERPLDGELAVWEGVDGHLDRSDRPGPLEPGPWDSEPREEALEVVEDGLLFDR
ncbi:MAG: carboxylesterase/lipase family protein [Acidimicrobiales bacterium]